MRARRGSSSCAARKLSERDGLSISLLAEWACPDRASERAASQPANVRAAYCLPAAGRPMTNSLGKQQQQGLAVAGAEITMRQRAKCVALAWPVC